MTQHKPLAEQSYPVGEPSAPIPNQGKDEMNLAEFPLARLGHHDTRRDIEYHGQIVDKAGHVLEQTWIVSGSARFGLPTEFADRVLVALIAISAKEHFASRKVAFTIYRVLTLMGLAPNQQHYKATKRALQQLVGVTIYSEGAFWDKTKQKRITTEKGFHVLEEFWLKSMEGKDDAVSAESGQGYIIWSERLWESFKAGYIKQLDTAFYFALEKVIARRLYRFLDKRMHYQNTYQIDVFDLAARLGMKPYCYPSEIIDKMKDSFAELKQQGYLASVEVIKVGKYTRVKFTRTNNGASLEKAPLPLTPPLDSEAEAPLRIRPTPVASRKNARLALLYTEYETPDKLKADWAEILQELALTLPSTSYAMLADSGLLAVQDAAASIAVPALIKDWAERQLSRKIIAALNAKLRTKISRLEFLPCPEQET